MRFRRDGKEESIESPRVVVAVPSYVAGDCSGRFPPRLLTRSAGFITRPVAEVFLGFPSAQLGRPLDGFGFLVPEREKRNILGYDMDVRAVPRKGAGGTRRADDVRGGLPAAVACRA